MNKQETNNPDMFEIISEFKKYLYRKDTVRKKYPAKCFVASRKSGKSFSIAKEMVEYMWATQLKNNEPCFVSVSQENFWNFLKMYTSPLLKKVCKEKTIYIDSQLCSVNMPASDVSAVIDNSAIIGIIYQNEDGLKDFVDGSGDFGDDNSIYYHICINFDKCYRKTNIIESANT